MGSIFEDVSCIPGIALDPRVAGLVRLCGLGFPGKRIAVYATTGEGTCKNEALAEAFADARARLVPSIVPADVFDRETSITSKVVAVATIADCRPLTTADESAAFFRSLSTDKRTRQGWHLQNIWPLEPFDATPAPGFFRVSVNAVVTCGGWWLLQRHLDFMAAQVGAIDPRFVEPADVRVYLLEADLFGLGQARCDHLKAAWANR